MATIADYLRPVRNPNDGIDPANVLLIVNSDAELSGQVADYYQTARGLGAHRLSFALGSNPNTTYSSASRYADIIVPVANYIEAHGIEAVICSASCPARFLAKLSGADYPVSFESILAASRYWKSLGGIQSVNYGIDLTAILPTGHNPAANSTGADYSTFHGSGGNTPGVTPTTPNGLGYDVAMTLDPYWIKHGPPIVAWGRLGFPAFDGAPAESYAETVRMIDDCLWAESQCKRIVDYFAMIADYSGNGRHQWQWYAWQAMKAAGHNCRYAHETNTGINATESAWFGQAHDVDWQEFKAGTAPVAADCYVGSIIRNLAVGDAYANSLQPKRGAWAFNWTSQGNRFVANLIAKGGAAGIGPAMEPYNVGMPDDGSVISAALRGYSLAEINWLLSPASWAMTAWGDPLYRPFAALGLTDGNLLTVANATPAKTIGHAGIDHAAMHATPARAATNMTPTRTATWQS